ncbi:UNVERIFIED_CONTAM: hypothetical protein Sradi_1745100 [Sesamum radiatum]|uniref:Uncharacterized protein n=1 Tax=Sesamum radiatum TaxID=300843 RepID=A0AAW2TU89_SESRA
MKTCPKLGSETHTPRTRRVGMTIGRRNVDNKLGRNLKFLHQWVDVRFSYTVGPRPSPQAGLPRFPINPFSSLGTGSISPREESSSSSSPSSSKDSSRRRRAAWRKLHLRPAI